MHVVIIYAIIEELLIRKPMHFIFCIQWRNFADSHPNIIWTKKKFNKINL